MAGILYYQSIPTYNCICEQLCMYVCVCVLVYKIWIYHLITKYWLTLLGVDNYLTRLYNEFTISYIHRARRVYVTIICVCTTLNRKWEDTMICGPWFTWLWNLLTAVYPGGRSKKKKRFVCINTFYCHYYLFGVFIAVFIIFYYYCYY